MARTLRLGLVIQRDATSVARTLHLGTLGRLRARDLTLAGLGLRLHSALTLSPAAGLILGCRVVVRAGVPRRLADRGAVVVVLAAGGVALRDLGHARAV